MRIRTDLTDLRREDLTPAERVLARIQGARTNLRILHKDKPASIIIATQEHLSLLEQEFVALCKDLEDLTRGERAVLTRALRIYASTYQQMMGAEKDPRHKADLRQYIEAADRLGEKLFGVRPPPTSKEY